MSLLLANGHPGAWRYPLGLVADEARLVSERQGREEALRGLIIHTAVAAAPNGLVGKDAQKALTKQFFDLVEELQE